ncbi:MAG TPA: hypothetical protein VKP78_05700 [bacterium]|nr:hypothetical protein [bacterium]
MAEQIPLEYRIFLTGPFNTGMKFDYSHLSNDYDKIRRKLLKKSRQNNSDKSQFYIERFKDTPGKQKQWLQSTDSIAPKELIFSDSQGKMQRDISLISCSVSCSVFPNSAKFDKIRPYFSEEPVLEQINLQFHEIGIGVFYGYLNIKLAKPVPISGNQYKNFTKILRDSFILAPGLQAIIKEKDAIVSKAASKILTRKERHNNIIDIDKIYPEETPGAPLWGHAVVILDKDYDGELPFGEQTKNLLVVSHPDGIIDMNNLSRGFVHIGWGMSLAVNIHPSEFKDLENTMVQLEFYWRAAQILNDLIMKYLEKSSKMKKFSLDQIKKSLNEIERLTVESELFYSYHMDYIKMLSPLSHFIYQETAISWRINQMLEYFDNKKDSLSKLHQQGEARIKESIDQKRDKMSNRLNVLLSILALLTLFSWAADSIGFLDATLSLLPQLKSVLIGGKFFVIIITPLMVLGIFFLFFRLTKAMKEIEA